MAVPGFCALFFAVLSFPRVKVPLRLLPHGRKVGRRFLATILFRIVNTELVSIHRNPLSLANFFLENYYRSVNNSKQLKTIRLIVVDSVFDQLVRWLAIVTNNGDQI